METYPEAKAKTYVDVVETSSQMLHTNGLFTYINLS